MDCLVLSSLVSLVNGHKLLFILSFLGETRILGVSSGHPTPNCAYTSGGSVQNDVAYDPPFGPTFTDRVHSVKGGQANRQFHS